MNEFNYYVYDSGYLIAGFVSLCTAISFCEDWNNKHPVDLVDACTGEVLDTCHNGKQTKGGDSYGRIYLCG